MFVFGRFECSLRVHLYWAKVKKILLSLPPLYINSTEFYYKDPSKRTWRSRSLAVNIPL